LLGDRVRAGSFKEPEEFKPMPYMELIWWTNRQEALTPVFIHLIHRRLVKPEECPVRGDAVGSDDRG